MLRLLPRDVTALNFQDLSRMEPDGSHAVAKRSERIDSDRLKSQLLIIDRHVQRQVEEIVITIRSIMRLRLRRSKGIGAYRHFESNRFGWFENRLYHWHQHGRRYWQSLQHWLFSRYIRENYKNS